MNTESSVIASNVKIKRVDLIAIGIVLPYAAILIGRDFSSVTIDSSVIYDLFWKKAGAFLGTALLSIIFLHGLTGKIHKPTGNNQLLHSAIMLAGLAICLGVAVGAYNASPLNYLVSDIFNMGVFILLFYTGYIIVQTESDARRLLEALSILGILLASLEVLIAVYHGSILPIRYGSGIALNILPIALVYFRMANRNGLLMYTLLICGVYVISSSARVQLVIFLVVFFIFLINDIKSFVSKSRGLASIIVMIISLLLIPVITASLGLNWGREDSPDALESMALRWEGTISDFSLQDGNSLLELSRGLDASNHARFLEAASALSSINNAFLGNGLGATFENERFFISNQANDHYIHITPVLIYFRQGVIGLIAWFFLLVTIVAIALKTKHLSTLANKYGFASILLLMVALLKFPTASGAFFQTFMIVMLLVGVFSRLRETSMFHSRH